MAILTYNHYINEANSFITDIRNNRNGYYVFAARPQPWTNPAGAPDDTAVLAVNNSIAQVEQSLYDDLLYGKLLVDSDVSNLIPRHNWVADTVYVSYDQTDPDLSTKQFYVVTDKYEVYKCIDNNNGANSYVKPTLTTAAGTFKTGDGYVWKYMYTVDTASNTKFTTSNYVPVATNTAVQSNTVPGSIDVIKVMDGGNGYVVYETGYIGGMPTNSRVQLPLTASTANNFYTNSSIYLKSGFGAGQIREISSYNSLSKQIVVSNDFDRFVRLDIANVQGTVTTGYYVQQLYDNIDYFYTQGYYNVDATIAQSDTGVTGRIISANTSRIQVLRNGPTPFLSTGGLPIIDISQSGTVKTGTVSVGNVGACNLTFVTSAGSGYTTNAAITIIANGSGTSAVAVGVVNAISGKIASISITTPGTDYFLPPSLTIAPPPSQTFNANSRIDEVNDVITLGRAANVVANTAGVSNTADVLLVTGANTLFSNNELIYYNVPTGNTAIPPLTGNTFYYVSFINASSLALSTTPTGANLDIAEARTTATGQQHTLISGTAHSFEVNDLITYTGNVSPNTVGGLVSGTTYYVQAANNTTVALKSTLTGAKIQLTKGPTVDGHSLRGATATGVVYCDNQIVRGSVAAQLNSVTNGYVPGEYIRVGANTTSNIRRVANTVNTTIAIVATPFSTLFNASANSHFKMPMAAEISSLGSNFGATGTVANNNLQSVQLAIDSSALPAVNFTVGEKVGMVDIDNAPQGANAIIAFSNSSTVILSSVLGTWLADNGGIPTPTQFYISGQSSLQFSRIAAVQSNPNITLRNVAGIFRIGYPTLFRTSIDSGTSSGNAIVVATSTLPNDQTEYQIGPTVRVDGDGSNCVAIAVVNTAPNSPYNIIGIDIINPGTGYTQANVTIYANNSHGSGATAAAAISPINGHGFDAVTELGGRYVGVNAVLDVLSNEAYDFLSYGKYRKVGILENPQFKDVKVTLTDFDRVNLTLGAGSASGWVPGEVVVQSSSNAAGVVVGGNASFVQLKNVKGTFNSTNSIYGYYSANSGNVVQSNTIYFPVGNSAQIITQSNSGSVGLITSVVSNTVYLMSNVVGQFATGDVMYDSVANAYATVSTIFTANGARDVSASFGNRFNQTARITLTASTGTFQANEVVQQDTTLAKGRVVSSTHEKDLVISSPSGAFFTGQTLTVATTGANGVCTFANTSYVMLTSVSQDVAFGVGNIINNGLGSTATIDQVLPVLVLHDVSDAASFQAGTNTIIGQTSGARGTSNNYLLIEQPDLVRDSGKVIYSESFAPVERSATTKQEIKLIIKF